MMDTAMLQGMNNKENVNDSNKIADFEVQSQQLYKLQQQYQYELRENETLKQRINVNQKPLPLEQLPLKNLDGKVGAYLDELAPHDSRNDGVVVEI